MAKPPIGRQLMTCWTPPSLPGQLAGLPGGWLAHSQIDLSSTRPATESRSGRSQGVPAATNPERYVALDRCRSRAVEEPHQNVVMVGRGVSAWKAELSRASAASEVLARRPRLMFIEQPLRAVVGRRAPSLPS